MTNINTIAAEVVAAQRFIMALYYAHGRADHHRWIPDENRPLVYLPDPIAFAEWYAAQWDEFQRGACSHCPSVQDAYDTYRRSLAS